MSGKYYWTIPLLFSLIFIETGFIFFSYLGFYPVIINGTIVGYAFPLNYLLFYNTSTGPFSSIFLNNFLWDGWSNAIAFGIYSMVFVVTSMFSFYRVRRAWFLVIGSVLSAVITGSVIRFYLPPGSVLFGQSMVLSGYAGIVLFFAIYEAVCFKWNSFPELESIIMKRKYGTGIAAAYFGAYIFVLIFAIGSLYGFFSPGAPEITRMAHAIALLTGTVLAGIFTVFFEGEPNWKREKSGPFLITEGEPEVSL